MAVVAGAADARQQTHPNRTDNLLCSLRRAFVPAIMKTFKQEEVDGRA